MHQVFHENNRKGGFSILLFLFDSIAYTVTEWKVAWPVVVTEGGGDKKDTTDSFCEQAGLFHKSHMKLQWRKPLLADVIDPSSCI